MRRYRKPPTRLTDMPEEAINLTPLIDVVFVVLIVFILVAPMLQIDRIQLADGSSAPREKIDLTNQQNPLLIRIQSNNQIFFNDFPISIDGLPQKLIEAYQINSDQIPKLAIDEGAPFGSYQAVKNAAELAGFKDLDVILKPK